ncbi:MAG: Grx4 family monothiol glutaredoxin [Sideroxydans sp.]
MGEAMDEKQAALEQIRKTVTENPIVLYMKGTPQFPQCGFSGRAAQVLKAAGVTHYVAVNVLEDPGAWHYLKDYAGFPTFPQLYLKGELIGGSDIMLDLYQQGELQKMIAEALRA